jgi:multicomponent Na+:H+ antiporter subunit F
MTSFLSAAAVFVLITIGCGLFRILHGPSEADRMMASQLVGTGGVAVLLLMAIATETPADVDVALMLALFAAFASIAFVGSAFSTIDRTAKEKAES